MDIGTIFLIAIGVILVLFIFDWLLAGGGATMGIINGACVMLSNPIGQGILLALLAILSILVYAAFFR